MIPVVLMAIGVADAIHILGKYYELVLIRTGASREELVSETMAEMWQPVVLTSLTTAAGFLSFLMMGMVPPGDDGAVYCHRHSLCDGSVADTGSGTSLPATGQGIKKADAEFKGVGSAKSGSGCILSGIGRALGSQAP